MEGVVLLSAGGAWEGDPLDPVSLAASHPRWRLDVEQFGPWSEMPSCAGLVPGVRCWRAEGGATEPGVLVVGACTSSLDVAWRVIEERSVPAWSSILAVEQRAGRGQMRRRWRSPVGNIHAALVLPGMEDWPPTLAPLVVGAGLAAALESEGAPLRMKWPNDLLHLGGKVGGILLEERKGLTVAGIGLNLVWGPPEEELREESAVPASDLSGVFPEKGPLGLWTELVKTMRHWYMTNLCRTNPSDAPRLLESRLAWLGDLVRVNGVGLDGVEVRLLGLAPDGGLRVGVGDAEQVLYSGSLAPVSGC